MFLYARKVSDLDGLYTSSQGLFFDRILSTSILAAAVPFVIPHFPKPVATYIFLSDRDKLPT
ncbi:hypothetical protein D3C76_1735750 [compost metagenome]